MARDAEALLQEACRRLDALIDDEACSFSADRRDGETCRESRTRIQGVPCAGCAQCEGRAFLKRVKEQS